MSSLTSFQLPGGNFGGVHWENLNSILTTSLVLNLKEEVQTVTNKEGAVNSKISSNISDSRRIVSELPKHLENLQVLEPQNEVVDIQIPTRIEDLDKFIKRAKDLEPDHPGYHDPAYKARRTELMDLASSYRHGEQLPRVHYSKKEIDIWGKVFRRLTKLYTTNACEEHQRVFPTLVKKCGYREDNIPQLQEVSDLLKEFSGFTIRPASGLLSKRDFLSALAFRVIHSTQYLRHHTSVEYTPEPDVCHELLGHIPLLTDPEFAEFSNEIGLASLGASDEDIEKLARIYWFTAEFGLCRQNGKLKAYGAGLLSSFGELEYCLSGKSELREFDPFIMASQEFPDDGFQPLYFVVESFQEARKKLREFTKTLKRTYEVKYNADDRSINLSRCQTTD